ncbi:nucleotidyl transferase AbiEii/AbiGii toxin family protein [Flagellimonas iocasae]|uniref:Nucleotidyl transferase AbiEii/AbiGii toxin family protein n=1 Tax=Flagellimonas iocasae TaxID=2055905 RepID=A0ABW4XYL1_9FLAO
MAAKDFYSLREGQKREVFTAISQKKGLPIYAVEKDWWVVQTLDIIFQLEMAQHLLFKGGTSLSKAWNIINRFSEDIDLALNREFLGFEGGLINKSQVKKLRKKSFEFVTTDFYEMLQIGFQDNGYDKVKFDFENLEGDDQDPVSILIYYPAVTDHSEYVLPRVKVELGGRSLKDPFTNCEIASFVGEEFSNQSFADTPITIPCVNPERTFLEKLFLLHEEFQRPEEKIRVERLSRHLYDVAKIYKSEHIGKAYNQELIMSIIRHRERFNSMKGVDYNTHYPPTLNPIPPEQLLGLWEADYNTMQTNMIPEDSPDFSDLLLIIKAAAETYNVLTFI